MFTLRYYATTATPIELIFEPKGGRGGEGGAGEAVDLQLRSGYGSVRLGTLESLLNALERD